jgi:hypothetical protein
MVVGHMVYLRECTELSGFKMAYENTTHGTGGKERRIIFTRILQK